MTISILVFSPTGNSEAVAEKIAKTIDADVRFYDLTRTDKPSHTFGQDETVVVAGPVYGGRIPAVMAERLKAFKFEATRAISVVTYGNRAVEDALLELNDQLVALGAVPVASACVVARHSMAPSVAADRPNEVDFKNLEAFAHFAKTKLMAPKAKAVEVPGNRPYRDWKAMPMTPASTDACLKCGRCAINCPTGAINAQNPKETDPEKCILCMRCVARCPFGGRVIPGPVTEMIEKKLAAVKSLKRENEFFF